MTLKERIHEFMRKAAYKPLTAEDLAGEMDLRAKDLTDFWPALAELEVEAAVIRTRYDKYGVPERMNLTVGKLSVSQRGFAFLLPENPDEEDVYVPANAQMGAMNLDRVVAVAAGKHAFDRGKGQIGGSIVDDDDGDA